MAPSSKPAETSDGRRIRRRPAALAVAATAGSNRRSRRDLYPSMGPRHGYRPEVLQRSAGRLSARALRLQPLSTRMSRCARAGDAVPRRLRRSAHRARLGARARRPLQLQPWASNRSRRLGAGDAASRTSGLDLRLFDVHALGVCTGGYRCRAHNVCAMGGERSSSFRRHSTTNGAGHPGVASVPPPGGYQPADLIFFGVDDGPSGHIAGRVRQGGVRGWARHARVTVQGVVCVGVTSGGTAGSDADDG